MKKYLVPYTMSYDDSLRQWEVPANSKKEAREIAVKQLESDQDVTHIGSVAHIVSIGKVNPDVKMYH